MFIINVYQVSTLLPEVKPWQVEGFLGYEVVYIDRELF